jgi:Spy/CpxP family protein refolding chaperone
MRRLQVLFLAVAAAAALGLAAAGLSGAAQASGQSEDPGLGRAFAGWCCNPEVRLRRLADALEMSPEQRAQAGNILDEARRATGGALLDDNMTWEQRRERFAQIRAQSKERMRQILTPDQLRRLDEMRGMIRERIRERLREHRPRRSAGA